MNKSEKLPIMNAKLVSRFCVVLILFITSVTCTKEDIEKQQDTLIAKYIADVNTDSIEFYVEWLQDMGTRSMTANNRRSVAEKVKNKFLKLGYSNARLDSFYLKATCEHNPTDTWQYNIIATLEGSLYPDSVSVIGSHYDSNISTGDPNIFAPGANDNASGVAASFEIARVYKKQGFTPKTTLQFVVFGAEEHGWFGSQAYCRAISGNTVIKMMLNNDMIAYTSTTNQSNWRVNIMDYPNSGSLSSDAKRICELYTKLGYARDNTKSNAGDSVPFYQRGVKSLWFISYDWDPKYHTIDDVVSNCNFDYCAEITKISCALLVEKNR